MAERTSIEWTDATVNFWWGCTKVGPGCDHCYAETWSKRTGESIWGPGVPRRKIKSAVKLLYKLHNGYSWWSADHYIGQTTPTPHRRVFIQSMSDLFDKEVPAEWFDEAWDAITACDKLNIQIVTKRISYVEKRLAGRSWPAHAGLLITVVNQEEADRDIPRLLALKRQLDIPWVGLSIEPMLGPIDLSCLMYHPCPNSLDGLSMDPSTGAYECCSRCDWTGIGDELGLDWVIVGGENGPRPLHPDWARSIRDQCATAGVPFLFKQWGKWLPMSRHFPGFKAGKVHVDGRSFSGNHIQDLDAEYFAVNVGKKASGRLLDGVQHDGLPEAFNA